MEIVGRRETYDGEYITVDKIYFLDRKETVRVWEAVSRKTHGDIVSVFALTKKREVVLERIFRIPIDKYVIELPAGLMDVEGEDPRQAARRELREETGYNTIRDFRLILEGPFNAGLIKDKIKIFFADKVEKVCDPDLEDVEDIEVMLVPLYKLVDFVLSPPSGSLVDIKILSILPILQTQGLI